MPVAQALATLGQAKVWAAGLEWVPVRVVAQAAVVAPRRSAVGKELLPHSGSDIVIDVGS